MGGRNGGVKKTSMKIRIGSHICARIQEVMDSGLNESTSRRHQVLSMHIREAFHIGSSHQFAHWKPRVRMLCICTDKQAAGDGAKVGLLHLLRRSFGN